MITQIRQTINLREDEKEKIRQEAFQEGLSASITADEVLRQEGRREAFRECLEIIPAGSCMDDAKSPQWHGGWNAFRQELLSKLKELEKKPRPNADEDDPGVC